MADLNTVILQGRLTRDPEAKMTKSGVECTPFSIAVNRIPNKNSGEVVADFIDCVSYSSTARFVSQYFKKGNMALVCGRLQARDYTDKDNNKRRAWEVIANEVHFCGGKSENNSGDAATAPQTAQNTFEAVGEEEDLPF